MDVDDLLHNRNFVRLLAGRVVTNAGDSLYYVATMWLVYRLTGSPTYTGIAGFLSTAPATVQFLFGPVVDRLPLRRVLVGTQLLQGVLVLVVPLAAAFDVLSVWVLLTLIPLLSLLNQPVYPAASAALPRIVADDQLVRANSLFSFAYQGVDAAFNAIGGLLVAALGAVTLFAVDSLTFGATTLLFATLAIPAVDTSDRDGPAPESTPSRSSMVDRSKRSAAASDGGRPAETSGEDPIISYLHDLGEGIAFVRGTVVAKLIVGAVVVNFAVGGALAVLPAYADGFGGASAYGLLSAALGTGLLGGALAGSVIERFPFGRVVGFGNVVGALAWLGAVAVDWLPASVLLFALALVPVGVTNVLEAALIQTLVPDELLGRVTAVLGSASTAMMPVGALVGGVVAGAISTTVVLVAAGGSLAVLGIYVLTVPSLRRLPPVSDVSTLTAK